MTKKKAEVPKPEPKTKVVEEPVEEVVEKVEKPKVEEVAEPFGGGPFTQE